MEESVDRAQLFCAMARFLKMLSNMGVRLHAQKSERWWFSQSISQLGFDVDAKEMHARVIDGARTAGKEMCLRRLSLRPGTLASAKEIL